MGTVAGSLLRSKTYDAISLVYNLGFTNIFQQIIPIK